MGANCLEFSSLPRTSNILVRQNHTCKMKSILTANRKECTGEDVQVLLLLGIGLH